MKVISNSTIFNKNIINTVAIKLQCSEIKKRPSKASKQAQTDNTKNAAMNANINNLIRFCEKPMTSYLTMANRLLIKPTPLKIR